MITNSYTINILLDITMYARRFIALPPTKLGTFSVYITSYHIPSRTGVGCNHPRQCPI